MTKLNYLKCKYSSNNMNISSKIFFLVLVLLIGANRVDAQDNPDTIKVDYSEIKLFIVNDSIAYQTLLNRYKKNDPMLTHQDYALIYYGYSFTPSYTGSFDDDKDDFKKLIDNQKYYDAFNLGITILKRNPVSLSTLYNMYYLCQALGKPVEEANMYILKYSKLLHTIALSGDGKSEETAFKVIAVNDEYQLMYNYWGVEEIISQSLVNNCDLIKFTSSQHYSEKEMYFDISRSLDYMTEMFK